MYLIAYIRLTIVVHCHHVSIFPRPTDSELYSQYFWNFKTPTGFKRCTRNVVRELSTTTDVTFIRERATNKG